MTKEVCVCVCGNVGHTSAIPICCYRYTLTKNLQINKRLNGTVSLLAGQNTDIPLTSEMVTK